MSRGVDARVQDVQSTIPEPQAQAQGAADCATAALAAPDARSAAVPVAAQSAGPRARPRRQPEPQRAPRTAVCGVGRAAAPRRPPSDPRVALAIAQLWTR